MFAPMNFVLVFQQMQRTLLLNTLVVKVFAFLQVFRSSLNVVIGHN